MSIELKLCLWTPHWDYEKIDNKRCRFSVANSGRSVGFHQCPRTSVEDVEGYGFCPQHTEKVKLRLNLIKSEKEVYVAKIMYDCPHLQRLHVIRETPKTIIISSHDDLIDKRYFSNKIQKSKEHVFNTMDEAIEWLIIQLSQSIKSKKLSISAMKSEIDHLKEYGEIKDG